MVKLDRCVPEASKQATILCKLEMQNPGGSLKDRIALNMIEEAEKRGEVTPGKTTIIDFTSGNTGIGYAMVAAAKGYKCIVIMPKVRPMLERYLICRQFGAEVHLFNPALGAPGALKYVKEVVAANPDYWWPNQLGNPDNPAVHEQTTGPEIWRQAGGSVDYFVHGIGTGGCVAGVGKFLKSVNPKCHVIALEPSESRVHVGAPPKPHGVVGWSPGVHSQFLEGFGTAAEDLSDAPRGVIDEWGHVAVRTDGPRTRQSHESAAPSAAPSVLPSVRPPRPGVPCHLSQYSEARPRACSCSPSVLLLRRRLRRSPRASKSPQLRV